MDVAQAPAHPSDLMVELKVASSKRVVHDRKPAACNKARRRAISSRIEKLDDEIICSAPKPRGRKTSSPRAESMIIGSIRARAPSFHRGPGTGDCTKLVLNNLISLFRYHEKEPKKAQATADACYIASKYKLGAERNYWMS
jgi:hypothetical protein